jgi:DNA mismatch repair protein MutL
VKELIENALDAGAKKISVETRQGGVGLIRVADDGSGIPPEELVVAFERHATSKLRSEDELWRIETLGFRGEALPSIAAAGDVELISRPSGALVAGRVVLRSGSVEHQGSAGAPPGTSVTVQRLFSQQPARLKFLRSPTSEAGQIASVVTHYALAYPEVRFSLRNDNRTVLSTPGTGDLLDAAAAVLGMEIASDLLAIRGEPAQDIQISGAAGSPTASRGNRNYISLFVNRRWIRNRALTFAVIESYQGLLPLGRFPIAIINITVPADSVDVNVHPTKAEVRFRDERPVFSALQRAIRAAISSRSPVPAFDTNSAFFESRRASAQAETAAWREQVAPARLPYPSPPGPAASHEATLSSEPLPMTDTLPLLRPVGQLANTYVVTEGPDGMYLIDQHAAHERVLYERFLAGSANGDGDVQPLLQPQTLELTARQHALFESFEGELARAGLAIEPFGEGAYLIRAVPAALVGSDIVRAINGLLDLLGREDGPSDDPAHRVSASLACHASVRAGQTMTGEEQRELVRLLEACEQPRTCPHGRPTMVHVSSDVLARQFRRR